MQISCQHLIDIFLAFVMFFALWISKIQILRTVAMHQGVFYGASMFAQASNKNRAL
jgi:hypothetical protein